MIGRQRQRGDLRISFRKCKASPKTGAFPILRNTTMTSPEPDYASAETRYFVVHRRRFLEPHLAPPTRID